MLCPANPQPPGFLDLAAPHSDLFQWAATTFLVLTLVFLFLELFSIHRTRRRYLPGAQRRTFLWWISLYNAVILGISLFFFLTLLWQDALRIWLQAIPASCRTPAISTSFDTDLFLAAVMIGVYGLLHVGNLILGQIMVQKKRRQLIRATP